jgi:regulation of enolase protein 1 (concanavalin A-like superfamily)
MGNQRQKLTMTVTPQSDYWRISHYGFTVDDAPFITALMAVSLKPKSKSLAITKPVLTKWD